MTQETIESRPQTPDEESRPRLDRRRAISFLERIGLLIVWLVIIGIFGVVEPQTFLTTSNFAVMFSSQSVLVVLSLGLILPMTAGDYDLSIAYNLTFSGMLIAVLNVNHHWSLPAAVAVALAVGLLVGCVNGAVVVLLRIDSFIVTLGTGTILAGMTLLISDSSTISGISPGLQEIVSQPRIGGFGLDFFYALLLTAAVWYMQEYTAVGRRLLFVGRGRDVARLTGIRVSAIRFGALTMSGLFGALAGVLYVGTTSSADPTSGTTLLLPGFAAAFLGSTTIMPGRFNAWGTLCATYFLVTGITGLSFLGAQVYVQDLFYGAALVVAVAFGQLARRRLQRRSAA